MKLTLAQIDPEARGISYYEWKAGELNRLFEQLGVTRQRARIQPATIQRAMEEKRTEPQK